MCNLILYQSRGNDAVVRSSAAGLAIRGGLDVALAGWGLSAECPGVIVTGNGSGRRAGGDGEESGDLCKLHFEFGSL